MQQYMLVPPQGAEPADEWVRLAVEAQMRNDLPTADRHYRQALRIDPSHVVATHNHAILFAMQSNLNEALLTMERAMIFDDQYGAVYMNYALMCLDAGRIDNALEAGAKAVELGKSDANGQLGKVHPNIVYAMILGAAGRSYESIQHYNAALDEDPKNIQAALNSCFAQTLSFCTPKDLLEQRARFKAAAKFEGTVRNPKTSKEWPRPLRVGYIGGDFKQHSAAMIFSHVIWHHTDKVLPYLYCSMPVNPEADAYTKRFQKIANGSWRDISAKNDDEAADMIRDDKIDILVDVAAHTAGGRLPVFLRRPAPLAVTAWGFAHGTGMSEVDYFFADEVSVPEAERQFFAEKIYYLPSLVTYEPPDYKFKDSNQLPYALNGFITFGSSARYEKLSEECLKVFAEILHQVPDAVLRLKDSAYVRPYSIKRVLGIMKGFDVDPKRIHFLIGTSHEEHMQGYRSSDLQLDPFPHCGGIVSLEQIYMGLPIITLYGTQPSGRNTSSVLTAMGRAEWIAKTPEEYVEKAVALANDLKTLREARKTLRDELLNSPVVAGYAERVEAAYQDIWERDILKS